MDTLYYHVRAKRVKVSGGADLVRLEPVPVTAPAPRPREERVLDFDRCRRALETKAAWRRLEQAAREETAPEKPVQEAPAEELPGTQRASQWLELAASAAIIVMCAAAVAAFLGLV